MQSELIGLDRVPGQIQSRGPLESWSDAILPAVAGDKVAAGMARRLLVRYRESTRARPSRRPLSSARGCAGSYEAGATQRPMCSTNVPKRRRGTGAMAYAASRTSEALDMISDLHHSADRQLAAGGVEKE